jgi:hypothetical protein
MATNKKMMLYAGLAVMLARKYRGVLPIKYLYRKTADDGFIFQPTMRGGAEDDKYMKGAVYPELMYNMDTRGKPNKISVGKINDNWRMQVKTLKDGTKRRYKRGGSIGDDKFMYKAPTYLDFSTQGWKAEKGGSLQGYNVALQKYNNAADPQARSIAAKPFTKTAAVPDDLLEGNLGDSAKMKTKSYKRLAVGKALYQRFKKHQHSPRQVTPKGMKARWIRGGMKGNKGKGGGNLKIRRTPGNQRLLSSMNEGDVEKLPNNHMMKQWYKLWQHNYDKFLRGQSQRVLNSFLKNIGMNRKYQDRTRPRVSTGKTAVVPGSGRQRRGVARKAPRYQPKTIVKRAAKQFGVVGLVSPEQFIKEINQSFIWDNDARLEKEFGVGLESIRRGKDDLLRFMTDAVKLQKQLNKNKAKVKNFQGKSMTIGLHLDYFIGSLVIKGEGGQISVSPAIIQSGKRHKELLQRNRLQKKKKDSSAKSVAKKVKDKAAKDVTNAAQGQITRGAYFLSAHMNAPQLSIEGESGTGQPIEKEMAIKLRQRISKAIGKTGDNLHTIVNIEKQVKEGGFKNWYNYWIGEVKKLERRTVEGQRGKWQDFMKNWVGPKTSKYRGGNVGDYLKAAKTWHSPGYIRPYVQTEIPKL